MLGIASVVVLWTVFSVSASIPPNILPMPHAEGDVYDLVNPLVGPEGEYEVAMEMEKAEDQVLEKDDMRTLVEADKELEEKLRMFEDFNRNKIGETLLQFRSDTTNESLLSQTDTALLSRPFRPMDCAELLVAGFTTSGEYDIYPFTCLCSKPVKVWCDMDTDGGGWTVITTRVKDGSVTNFNRTWEDYRIGFGNTSMEYWIGNELLHSMTTNRQYHLRMDVNISPTDQRFGFWTSFVVLDETSRYKLKLGTFSTDSTFSYDCMAHTRGQKFSANNRDSDRSRVHCAIVQGTGWWFKTCTSTVFNPSYLRNKCYNNVMTMPNQVQLKIRPTVCSSHMKSVFINKYDCSVC